MVSMAGLLICLLSDKLAVGKQVPYPYPQQLIQCPAHNRYSTHACGMSGRTRVLGRQLENPPFKSSSLDASWVRVADAGKVWHHHCTVSSDQ